MVQQAALVLALLQVQVVLAPRRERGPVQELERVQEQVLVLRREQVRAVQEPVLVRRLLHRRPQ